MKRLSRLVVLSLSLILLLLTINPMAVQADTNDFVISDFVADYYLGTSDKQGSLDIDEKLSVIFSDQNHGIYRALPERYNGNDLHLKVTSVTRDGTAEKYTASSSNGNKVLKIGNASQTITGNHNYEIRYSVENVIRLNSTAATNSNATTLPRADQLIWNTNGTEWSQPFQNVTARLHLPADLAAKYIEPSCYTGAAGNIAQDCSIDINGSTVTYRSNRLLNGGENMTFSGDFPAGTFQKPDLADWWQDNRATVLQIAIPVLVAFILAYRYWHRSGKDTKGQGTIVPEYTPPDGLRAAEADVITSYKLGTNAISATIIDLAIRKYLRIIEGESKGVLGLGKHRIYSLERLQAPTTDSLKPYESQILAGLFPVGDQTEISNLKSSFYVTAQSVQKQLPASLTQAGYFPKDPKRVGAVLFGLACAIFVGGWLLFGADWALGLGLVISGALLALFARLMPNRTAQGVAAKDKLAGLKLYMNTVEKDRIAMLQSPNRPYDTTHTAGGPPQTVELFEKLLPYAMVMGVEQQWAKQFESIYTTPPDWYGGNWSSFNAGLLVGSLSSSMSAMNASFAAPSSSGSGSGGGFSGGGGGGGGGGGW